MSKKTANNGSFRSGNTLGRGRPPGRPNKITASLRNLIVSALDAAGGKDYLVSIAKTEPSTFLSLVGKLLPSEVRMDSDNVLRIEGGLPERPKDWSRQEQQEETENLERERAGGSPYGVS